MTDSLSSDERLERLTKQGEEECKNPANKLLYVCSAEVLCHDVFEAWCNEGDGYNDAEHYAAQFRLTERDLEMLFATFIKYQDQMEEHFEVEGLPGVSSPVDFIQLKAKVEAWSKVGMY